MAGVDATRRVVLALAPPLGGAVVALATLLATPGAATPVRAPMPDARLAGTRAEDCAPCHAREVAEWSASAMGYAARSPLVGALESLVEEQVGRQASCPNGVGILRVRGADACVDDKSGVAVTGAGGEHWCVSCHAPGENLRASMPPWSALGDARTREPMRDLLPAAAREGVSCAACHSTVGPVAAHASRARGYEGNPTWTSVATGLTFLARPEDARGLPGIANSGYRLDPRLLLGGAQDGARVHPAPADATERYLASSEFCGACHDVRLFGSDVRGAARGEHFKRLRNAYSEWRTWADAEARAGRHAASCQDCHMSLFPVKPPGTYAEGLVAPSSKAPSRIASHWFTGVEIPFAEDLPDALVDDPTRDADGVPVGLRARRDLLLRAAFRMTLGAGRVSGRQLLVPLTLENVGAGHRVPAGFSQERETWVELRVTDARGALVYEVGRLDRPDADLADKRFARVTATEGTADGRGRPLGLFGADVVDGPDVPRWTPDPRLGGTRFFGAGLVNLQNGFQRCVRCIGALDAEGRCQPGPEQGRTRADRFADGAYDPDTGECRSNLDGEQALFETYFPVGALDADRGVLKAPDAIVDTRSAPPGVPLTYTYALDTGGHARPFTVRARLLFRAFPPYLVRAFAAYEREQAREGHRPSGAQVDERMLRRDDPVELAVAEGSIP
jgi:eukaryotic-like serine/threonine-protein kinase